MLRFSPWVKPGDILLRDEKSSFLRRAAASSDDVWRGLRSLALALGYVCGLSASLLEKKAFSYAFPLPYLPLCTRHSHSSSSTPTERSFSSS